MHDIQVPPSLSAKDHCSRSLEAATRSSRFGQNPARFVDAVSDFSLIFGEQLGFGHWIHSYTNDSTLIRPNYKDIVRSILRIRVARRVRAPESARVEGDSRTLGIDLQRSVKRDWKTLILFLSDCLSSSRASLSRSTHDGY